MFSLLTLAIEYDKSKSTQTNSTYHNHISQVINKIIENKIPDLIISHTTSSFAALSMGSNVFSSSNENQNETQLKCALNCVGALWRALYLHV